MALRKPGTLVPLVIALAAACGPDAPREAPPPPPSQPPPRVAFSGPASAALPRGVCEPATGAMIGRAGLRGVLYTIDPDRQITILYDARGALRFYRDQVAGAAGYAIRMDMETDSAWATSRATGARLFGSPGEFRTRAEFGPPLAIADSVRRRCGLELVAPAPAEPPPP